MIREYQIEEALIQQVQFRVVATDGLLYFLGRVFELLYFHAARLMLFGRKSSQLIVSQVLAEDLD